MPDRDQNLQDSKERIDKWQDIGSQNSQQRKDKKDKNTNLAADYNLFSLFLSATRTNNCGSFSLSLPISTLSFCLTSHRVTPTDRFVINR